jgi:hypothetical protein
MEPETIAFFDQLEAQVWEDMYAVYLGDPLAFKLALGLVVDEFMRHEPKGGPLSTSVLSRLGAMAVAAKMIGWEAACNTKPTSSG